MKSSGLLLLPFLFLLVAAITLACGSPKMTASNCPATGSTNGDIPQSISLCPVTADAQNYQGGLVQFVATGTYQSSPSPAAPLAAFWGACYQNAPTTEISITNKGVASCNPGATGQFAIFASVPTQCDAITACGGACQVSGYAQLTCP